jgi:probable DNA metabolism protein
VMIKLHYDGTFEGLLAVIFTLYDRKISRFTIERAEWQTTAFFEDVIDVPTDNAQATRVLKGLRQKLSPDGIQRVYIAHLGAGVEDDNAIAGYIKYAFDSPVNIEDDYGNRDVLRVSEIVNKMRRERHRMEAFIRFKKLQDDMFYAAIEPDFNVLPLLVKHFKNRYSDQKWMIYDIKRDYGIYYNLHDVEFISMEFSSAGDAVNVVAAFGEEEGIYQSLWKNYYKNVNIPARKNMKLHLRHIPKRYWRHLTEKF